MCIDRLIFLDLINDMRLSNVSEEIKLQKNLETKRGSGSVMGAGGGGADRCGRDFYNHYDSVEEMRLNASMLA